MISNAEFLLPCSYLSIGNDLYQIGVEEMIKRISIISCVVLLLVVTMALPAFAAETDDFYFIDQPKDVFFAQNMNEAQFSVSVHGDAVSYRWEYKTSPNSDWIKSSWNGNILRLKISSSDEYYLVRCIVTSSSGEVITSNEAAIINYPNYFLYYASRAIHFVTSWVGSITSALVDSNGAFHSLLPVIAIGIAVTAVLLVIKIFKSFSWGF